MVKKEEIKTPILTPEEIEKRHKVQFIQAYNELIKEYGYALQPVIKLELVKLPKVEDKEEKNVGNNSNNSK